MWWYVLGGMWDALDRLTTCRDVWGDYRCLGEYYIP